MTRTQGLPATSERAQLIWAAANTLAETLSEGTELDHHGLRRTFDELQRGRETPLFWCWNDTYEADEVAANLHILRNAKRMKITDADPKAALSQIQALRALEPPHTRGRSGPDDLQHFATPLEVAYVAARAAAIEPSDIILEPSAGTGVLAAMSAPWLPARSARQLLLNERDSDRQALLGKLFANKYVSGEDAEELGTTTPRPSVIIMNPPFTTRRANGKMKRNADMAHLRAAYDALQHDGRLVAITATDSTPQSERWKQAFKNVENEPVVLRSVPMQGRMFQSRGTLAHTRMTVIEKPSGDNSPRDERCPATAPVESAQELLTQILEDLPRRRR